MRKLSPSQAVLLVLGPSAAYFGAFALIVVGCGLLFGIPYGTGLSVLAESAGKLRTLLFVSPVVGFLAGHWIAGMIMARSAQRPQPLSFMLTLGHIVLLTAVCFYAGGNAVVGKPAMALWDDTVGLWRFGLAYCFAAPIGGYFAAFAAGAVLGPKEPFTV